MQSSIHYRATGRQVTNPRNAKAELKTINAEKGFELAIVRDNQVLVPEELGARQVQGREFFRNGNPEDGIDDRLNAVGDVADNATGYQIAIDTLTYIKKQISQQKFYRVAPADYVPVVVGEGAFSQQLLTNRSFEMGDDFESGNLRTGASDSRLMSVDVAVDGIPAAIINWAKTLGYTIFDVELALRANNWDIIGQKHRARKTNWDLGIQKICFLGSATDTRVPGLLTNTSIDTVSGVIAKAISSMDATELQTFVTTLISTYFAHTNSTAMPNRFVIPYTDFLGLQAFVPAIIGTNGATYPVSILEYLTKAFKAAVAQYESDFQILPLSYADAANNPAGLQYYMLYRKDPESLRMDIPVPYTTTQPNSLNNMSFQDVGYGQYTGVVAYRNLETIRMQYTP